MEEQLRSRIQSDDGAPVLDEDFMTNVPGLFMTGLLAARDFGPFFGFMRATGLSARLIAKAVAANAEVR